MKNLNKKHLNELKKDSLFKKRMSDEINQIIDLEMLKPDDEIDWELIDECTDSLLFLNNMENETQKITPFLVKKYRTRYTLTNLFKATSYIAAAVALGFIAWGIVSNQSQPKIINEVETTDTTTAYVEQTVEEITQEIELTTAPKESPTTTTTTNAYLQTSHSKKPLKIIEHTTSRKIAEASTTKKTIQERTTKIEETTKKPQVQSSTTEATTKKPKPQPQPTTQKHEEPTTAPTTVIIEGEKSITSISGEFGKGFKKVYFVGEELDLFGLTVIANYDDNSTGTININRCTINGFSSDKAGTKTVIVTYEGHSFTFNVNVASRG